MLNLRHFQDSILNEYVFKSLDIALEIPKLTIVTTGNATQGQLNGR